MKIEFEGKAIEFTPAHDNVKIYAVPVEYSDDGFYIADYKKFSIEPVPASDVRATTLLLTLRKHDTLDEYNEIYKANGVEFNA